MGGGSKKGGSQTVGYKYYFGEHILLAKNKIILMAAQFQDRVAWQGFVGGGETIHINKPELFGGEGREGGVEGYVDILNGDSAQGRNSYLAEQISATISAFRHVSSVVLKDFYHGNNPYPKPPSFKATDDEIYRNWLPSIGRIPRGVTTGVLGAFFYIAIDNSADVWANGWAQTQKDGVTDFLEGLKGTTSSVRIVAFSNAIDSQIELFDCDDTDYDTLITFVDGISQGGTTPVNISQALGTTIKTTGTAPKQSSTPYFEQGSLSTTAYNNLVFTPEFGWYGNDDSAASGYLYLYNDVSGIPSGTTLNFVNQQKIYANWNNSCLDSVSVTAWTQAQLDAGGVGSTTTFINQAFASGTSNSTRNHNFNYVIPANVVQLRWKITIGGPRYFSGLYTRQRWTQPVITYQTPSGADWEVATNSAPTFFDQADANGLAFNSVSIGDWVDANLGDGTAIPDNGGIKRLIFISGSDPINNTQLGALTNIQASPNVNVSAIRMAPPVDTVPNLADGWTLLGECASPTSGVAPDTFNALPGYNPNFDNYADSCLYGQGGTWSNPAWGTAVITDNTVQLVRYRNYLDFLNRERGQVTQSWFRPSTGPTSWGTNAPSVTNEEYIDNTDVGGVGVPIIPGTDAAALTREMEFTYSFTFASWIDMNPAHMLRYSVTASDTAGELNTDKMGNGMSAAAQTLFNEDFGLSFFLRTSADAEVFKAEVERHIDGAFYFDPITESYELKLIRDDYVYGNLFVFDETNVSEWGDECNREIEEHLPNRLTLIYRKQDSNKTKSITVVNSSDLAALNGEYRSAKVTYEGIRDDTLAAQVADRDLHVLSTPKWSGTIVVPYCPVSVNRGSAIIIRNTKFQMDIVARVTKKTYFAKDSQGIRLHFTEDVYRVKQGTTITGYESASQVTTPSDALNRTVLEAPYYMAYLVAGSSELNTQLENNPGAAALMVAATAPSVVDLGYNVAIDYGVGWYPKGYSDYTPTKNITLAVTKDPAEDVLTVSDLSGMSNVVFNSLALLGSEFVRIDSVVEVGGVFEITVGRGCLDTVPVDHPIGEPLLFIQGEYFNDGTEYGDGEILDVRFLSKTAPEEQSLSLAPEESITFASRAVRPYPPGNFLVDGLRTDGRVFTGASTIPLTWKHRNRLTQISGMPEDYLADNITPETGTTYEVRLEAFDENDLSLGVFQTTAVGNVNTYALTITASSIPQGTVDIGIRVYTLRDGYESFRSDIIKIIYAGGFGYGFGYNFGG